jgi:lysine biosynthesis protein LysW
MENKQNNLSIYVPCPECDTTLSVPKDVKVGEIIECPTCGAECEIVSLVPLKISPLEEEK